MNVKIIGFEVVFGQFVNAGLDGVADWKEFLDADHVPEFLLQKLEDGDGTPDCRVLRA